MSAPDPLTAELERTLRLGKLLDLARETGTIYAHPDTIAKAREVPTFVETLADLGIALRPHSMCAPGQLIAADMVKMQRSVDWVMDRARWRMP